MTQPSQAPDIAQECRRLTEQVTRDQGTHALSPTDLAFFQTYCDKGDSPLAPAKNYVDDVEFAPTSGIDESGSGATGTIMDEPDAGRPDDAGDANPAAPDPAITRE